LQKELAKQGSYEVIFHGLTCTKSKKTYYESRRNHVEGTSGKEEITKYL
jgi:hypothetical protein